MSARILILALVISFLCMVSAGQLYADELKVVVNTSEGFREVLTAHIGKRVSVRTDAGEGLEGNVVSVGLQLVHIEKLTGKEFYDAVVKIDRISSVVVRVRGN
ncbi:MAG: hypothetical protein AB1499_09900 [Nitrospirota bacterium]